MSKARENSNEWECIGFLLLAFVTQQELSSPVSESVVEEFKIQARPFFRYSHKSQLEPRRRLQVAGLPTLGRPDRAISSRTHGVSSESDRVIPSSEPPASSLGALRIIIRVMVTVAGKSAADLSLRISLRAVGPERTASKLLVMGLPVGRHGLVSRRT